MRVFCLLGLWFLLPVAAETGPKIRFDTLLHDFGEVEQTQTVQTEFRFTNIGDAALEIEKVAPSCGCTTTELTKKSYAPGEKGTIPVTFNPSKFEGAIMKRITINTNDLGTPKTVVTIKATVLVDVNANPSTVFFQKAEPGRMNLEEILVSTKRMETLVITDLLIEPEFLSAELVTIDEKNAKIVIKADGALFPKDKSRLNGYLTYTTNSPTQPKMRAAITLNVVQPIKVTPRSLYFYASKAGQKRDMTVVLSSTDGKPFRVISQSCDLPQLSAQLTKDEGHTKTYTVSLSPTAAQGKFQGNLSLITETSGQETLTINIRGSVVP